MARKLAIIIAVIFMVSTFALKVNAQQQPPPSSGNTQAQGQASSNKAGDGIIASAG